MLYDVAPCFRKNVVLFNCVLHITAMTINNKLYLTLTLSSLSLLLAAHILFVEFCLVCLSACLSYLLIGWPACVCLAFLFLCLPCLSVCLSVLPVDLIVLPVCCSLPVLLLVLAVHRSYWSLSLTCLNCLSVGLSCFFLLLICFMVLP